VECVFGGDRGGESVALRGSGSVALEGKGRRECSAGMLHPDLKVLLVAVQGARLYNDSKTAV
jgi:hypothetical protein